MRVDHTAVWTADLDRARAFYEDGLGLEHVDDFVGGDGVQNYYVGGNGGAAIQFKYDGDRTDVASNGMDHIALVVDDTEAIFDAVVERFDPPVVKPPTVVHDGDKLIAFVEDPDGHVVEFVEHR